jgi:hypothetical protein
MSAKCRFSITPRHSHGRAWQTMLKTSRWEHFTQELRI